MRAHCLLALLASIVLAQMLGINHCLADQSVYSIVTRHSPVHNAWPGTDGLIGTQDDVIDGNLSPVNASQSNLLDTFSFNAFDFVGDGSVTDAPRMPPGMNAMAFIQGTITVDRTVVQQGSGPIINNWNVSGTEPFPGHGAYSSQIFRVNSGSYNVATHAFELNVDFTANLAGGTAEGVNFDLSGQAFLVDAADFGNSTGNVYVDTVLIPMAQSKNATSLFFIDGSGIVPESTGGSGGFFPQMPIQAVIVAITTDTTGISPIYNLLFDE